MFDPQWDQVLEFLAGCRFEKGSGHVDQLLREILAMQDSAEALKTNATIIAIVGRMLWQARMHGYMPAPDVLATYERLLQIVDGIFSIDGAALLRAPIRIAAAESIGRADNAKLNPTGRLLPVLGTPNLLLGEYPVTVSEFQLFVDQGGYSQRSLWHDGWELQEHERWEAPADWDYQRHFPNRPVVNVSWYEAAAYCRWLAIETGQPISLPHSGEWQAAAEHPEGPFPWGAAEPTEELLNFDQHIGCPSPVGVYPAGRARGGHADMAGNVWEWCRDSTAKGYSIVRGGGWYSIAKYARSDYQYPFHPGNRYHDLGFRLACVMSPGACDSRLVEGIEREYL